MTEWVEVALGDVVEISWGDTTTTKASYTDSGYLAYSASGPDGFLPHFDHGQPGVVISAIGAQCGKTWLAGSQWSCIKNTMWFRSKSEHLTDYLFYATSSPGFWPRRGAAQPFISLADAKATRVRLPPVSDQAKIANLLRSIDDLIENNRRRIRVLEGMAQAIYREWCVHFRFPGHENATFVDSPLGPIPEGWAVEPLSDLGTLIRGRSYRKHELVEEGGLPFVNLKCAMRGGGFRLDGLKRYSGEFKPEQLVGHGDIILAVTDLTQGREILAQATLVPRLAEGQGVISLDIARIIPSSSIDRLPLYFALRCGGFADRVKEYANGATVLHLSPKHVEAGQLVWPEKALRERFNSSVEPMISSLDELRDSTERLGGMRDLLLPKLVSGEIDVSDLDIDAVLEGVV